MYLVPGGVLSLRGVYLVLGVSWGVSAWGVCAPGGVCSGGCLLLGGGIPACTEADTPPVNKMNDRQV